MLLTNDRASTRAVFFDAWERAANNHLLSDLQRLVVDIIRQHPEYQFAVEDRERWQDEDDFPGIADVNPFLHFGLHLAVAEQVLADRPAGVRDCYRQLCARKSNEHEVIHQMMEALAQWLADAGQGERTPDEEQYLTLLRRL
jgi:hypothetical protein